MDIKIVIQSVIFIMFFIGVYQYLVNKSKKCENKECECPIKDNLTQGYMVVGIISLIALSLFVLVELFIR